MRLAADIAAHSALATQVGKAFVNRDAVGGFNESVEATALLFGTAEHRAAFTAFRERPLPETIMSLGKRHPDAERRVASRTS